MLFLLDLNVLIDANRDYYPLDRVPQFWDWLIHVGDEGLVKVPQEMYDEIKQGNDELAEWIKRPETKGALVRYIHVHSRARLPYRLGHSVAASPTDLNCSSAVTVQSRP